MQVGDRLERQVRIDRAGAVADQQAEVMHLAGLAGFDDQPGLRAGAFADQVMMHGGGGEQAGDRRLVAIDAAIGEDQDRRRHPRTACGGVGAELVERLLQSHPRPRRR